MAPVTALHQGGSHFPARLVERRRHRTLGSAAECRARDAKPDFRSAVALYPGCTRLEITAWSARIPTLILAAGADDWSSAKACEQMVAGARGRSAHASIVVYPGAHHDFDHPNRPLQVRSGYAFSVDNSGKVHSGTNSAARADAIRRVTLSVAQPGAGTNEQHSERE